MTFDCVFEILETRLIPPTGQLLHTPKHKDCTFYPFAHEGKIFTIDSLIWASTQANKYDPDDERISTTSYPTGDVISEAITREMKAGTCILFAFSDSTTAPTIDPDVSRPLSRIPTDAQEKFRTNFIDSGFDVIDVLTGISGLCDIGYTPHAASMFAGMKTTITEHRLLQNEEDARQITELASEYVPEHAPFYPIKIFSRLYPRA